MTLRWKDYPEIFVVVVQLLSCVLLFVAPWTVACHLLGAWNFPGSEVPFPTPGDVPDGV